MWAHCARAERAASAALVAQSDQYGQAAALLPDSPRVVQRFGEQLDQFVIDEKPDSAAMWDEIAGKSWFFDHAMAVHIQSSALSGFLCAIVENMVSGKSNDSTVARTGRGGAAAGGASDVESALMLEQLDALLDQVALHPDAEQVFSAPPSRRATLWLRATPRSGSRDSMIF